MIPGEIFPAAGEIELNAGRDRDRRSRSPTPATGRSRSAATTTSPRPTRRCASTAPRRAGMRLDIAAGTAVRFEPGQTREVRAGRLSPARASCTASAARSEGAL